ncbi:MAG: MFS transporter [Alphaproteobacteria bacterium]|nr:MFS transporter [Alphaproteobacteria bacterium]
MSDTDTKNTHIRFLIIAVLFIISSINYASRATMSFAAVPLAKEIGISTVQMGWVLSAFGWSYVAGQIPGGAMLDRYGSRTIYLWSISLWAIFTGAQAFVSYLSVVPVFISLFMLRLLLGASESPSFPANARIVANWFPNSERGTASAIFNASQYFSLVAFAPLMGWLAQDFGWRSVFLAMGIIGLIGAALFWAVVDSPARHKWINKGEFDHIEKNGALVNLDRPADKPQPIRWSSVGQLLSNRMLLGIYLAQYCITALTYFYATWFPIYLIQARGMSLTGAGFASAGPAIAGFVGGVLGGVASDLLLKKGVPLSRARKTVILVGLVISCSILLANYTDSQFFIMMFMSFAFFGKGVAALGWAVMSDAAPREATGLSGSIFNLFGNAAGIFTPIGIGYILAATGNNWNMALIFVFAHSIVAMISYGFITGEIKRIVLRPV